MAPPNCPGCGRKLAPSNVTVEGDGGPITPPDAIDMLVNDIDEMLLVTIVCDNCGEKIVRNVTIRTM